MLSFFFNDTPTTEIYTLSLHDALPILAPLAGRRLGLDYRLQHRRRVVVELIGLKRHFTNRHLHNAGDRKSTRLNSSHMSISYAVFCLKKKKKSKVIEINNINNARIVV